MRATGATTLAFLLLLAACAGPATAIFADQAGQYDWLQQHVGRVNLAALAAKPRPRLFVASQAAGTVAALSPKDGSLLWRRVLAEGDSASRLQPAHAVLLTLTDGGKQLTAWDAGSGAAAWAATVAGSSELASAEAADVAVSAHAGSSSSEGGSSQSVAVVAAAGSAKVGGSRELGGCAGGGW